MQNIDKKLSKLRLPKVPWYIGSNQEFEQFMHEHPDLQDDEHEARQEVPNLVQLKKPLACQGCGTVFTMYTPGYEDACPFCLTPMTIGGTDGPAQR